MIRRIKSGGPFEEKIGYCRAVVAGGFVFVSGTVGQNHQTGEVPSDIKEQCRLALEHIDKALRTAGASLGDVVRVTYYLRDINEFEHCWPLLRASFGAAPPAATAVEARLVSHDFKIEIEVTALHPGLDPGPETVT